MCLYFKCITGLICGICWWGLGSTPALPVEDSPLRQPVLLSGNFGELRETHFHSGIDLKTGGREGLPVVCVKDGVVTRVKVSATGYGNALYVEHADGTTTVYGHLQRYHPRITSIVREKQYREESFETDIDMKSYGISFKRGDTLAFSGNTGSSGGPHLHFEYRDTRTEAVLNPLLFLKIRDHMVPKIRAVYFYRLTEEGCIEKYRRIVPRYVGNRQYEGGSVSLPAGKWGIGLYLTDVMNDSWNKLGIYRIALDYDGKKGFGLKVDTCLFDRNYLVNELKDFGLYRQAHETVYRTFGHHISAVPGVEVEDEGFCILQEGDVREVQVKVGDINGNEVCMRLKLTGRKAEVKAKREVLDYRKSHRLQQQEYSLKLDSGALFYALPRMAIVDTMTLADGSCHTFFKVSGQEEPLMKPAQLEAEGYFDAHQVICRITDKKVPVALATWRTEKGLAAFTNVLGCFVVMADTLGPEIRYTGVAEGRLRFMVRDDLSGITWYRGEVNGKWCLFEYDAKNDLFMCSTREPVFRRGKNEVVLNVKDGVGNVTQKKIEIELKNR